MPEHILLQLLAIVCAKPLQLLRARLHPQHPFLQQILWYHHQEPPPLQHYRENALLQSIIKPAFKSHVQGSIMCARNISFNIHVHNGGHGNEPVLCLDQLENQTQHPDRPFYLFDNSNFQIDLANAMLESVQAYQLPSSIINFPL